MTAISKAAKERKIRDKIESENTANDFSINYGLVFGFIGTAVAIASLYYKREEFKRKESVRETIKPVTIKEEPKKEPEDGEDVKTINKNPANGLIFFY